MNNPKFKAGDRVIFRGITGIILNTFSNGGEFIYLLEAEQDDNLQSAAPEEELTKAIGIYKDESQLIKNAKKKGKKETAEFITKIFKNESKN